MQGGSNGSRGAEPPIFNHCREANRDSIVNRHKGETQKRHRHNKFSEVDCTTEPKGGEGFRGAKICPLNSPKLPTDNGVKFGGVQGRSQDFFLYRGEENFGPKGLTPRPVGSRMGVGFSGRGSQPLRPTSAVSSLIAAKRFLRVLSVQSSVCGQFGVVYCSNCFTQATFAKARAMKNNLNGLDTGVTHVSKSEYFNYSRRQIR